MIVLFRRLLCSFLTISLLAVFISPSGAVAAEPLRFSARIPYQQEIKLPRGSLRGNFFFDATFELSVLMGEPIINCAATWTHDGATLTAKLPQGERRMKLTDAQIDRLTFYGLQLRLAPGNFAGINARLYCDAGIVGHGDKKPFNVAGSPDWGKLICLGIFLDGSPCGEDSVTEWADKQQARDLFGSIRQGMGATMAIHRLEVDAGDLLAEIIEEQSADGALAVFEEQLNEISEKISRAAGEKVDLMRDTVMADPDWKDMSVSEKAEMIETFAKMWTDPDLMSQMGFGDDDIAVISEATAGLGDRHAQEREDIKTLAENWNREGARIRESSATALSDYRATLKPGITSGKQGPFSFHQKIGESGGYGFKDRDGNVVLAPRLEWADASDFSQGLGRIRRLDESYAFIDLSGREMTSGMFGERLMAATDFGDGLAAVTLQEESGTRTWYLIDTNGGVIAKLEADRIYPFNQGRAVMYDGSPRQWYFINTSGEVVLGPYQSQPSFFSDAGYATVGDAVITVDGAVISDGWNEPVILAHRYLRAKESGSGAGVFDIASGRTILPYEPGQVVSDIDRDEIIFIRTNEVSLARKDPTCRKKGWEQFRTDKTVYDESGAVIDRSSETGERTIPDLFCLTSRPAD